MYKITLERIQQNIRERNYVMTRHAKIEMEADGFSISDVECGILNGRIIERQKDRSTHEWKYRIRGNVTEHREIEVIVKFNFQQDSVIITVYSII